jgi:predicted RNase H-like HicB family nuclease
MIRYVALIEGEAGAYNLVVPDLPGCTSTGRTITEVLSNAAEAARLWITDTPVAPRPSAYNDVASDEKVKAVIARGGMLAIVVLEA